MGDVVGVLLAAGAGRRMGSPKALLRHPDGTAWVARAATTLAEGGCARVVVVIGAAADQVAPAVPPSVLVVVADNWAEGMGASLRAGLTALLDGDLSSGDRSDGDFLDGDLPDGDDRQRTVAALVGLVDTPGVTRAVVARLVAAATPSALARAAYRGVAGHPVLLGREHWRGVVSTADGDAGARVYLRDRPVTLVECADVGDGVDVDTPVELPPI